MEKTRFEAHLLSEKPLPFIFHTTQIQRNMESTAQNWHPNIEILYFTEGEGVVINGEETLFVSAGDIVVINSNMTHAVKTGGVMVYHCLILDNDFCRKNGLDTDNIRFTTHIQDNTLNGLYESVLDEYNNQDDIYRTTGIKSAVLTMLVYLARQYTEGHAKIAKNPYTNGINYSIGYIKSHITEQLTVELLARQAGLSKYYFAREFKKTTGHTPIGFINSLRCENARKFLQQGEYSVSDISQKCGFENTSYFIKTFKKYMGSTPGKYGKGKETE